MTVDHAASPPTRSVHIPGSDDHDGWYAITVTLPWICPQCGGPRGTIHPAISYDGSRRLACDGWQNPCGHIDFYSAVRAEAQTR